MGGDHSNHKSEKQREKKHMMIKCCQAMEAIWENVIHIRIQIKKCRRRRRQNCACYHFESRIMSIAIYCNYCIQMHFDLYALILYRCYACMFDEILAPYLKLIRLMTANHVIAYTCDKGDQMKRATERVRTRQSD